MDEQREGFIDRMQQGGLMQEGAVQRGLRQEGSVWGRPTLRTAVVGGFAAVALTTLPLVIPSTAAAASPVAADSQVRAALISTPTLTWSQRIADGNTPIAESSPTVASLADGPAVVVGDRSGKVYAFHLGDGAASAGWSGGVGLSAGVDSTPSVSGSGSSSIIYVGAGSPTNNAAGGYYALNANGSQRWYHPAQALPSGGTAGVQASLAVGDLQGGTDVVAESYGQEESAFDGPSGSMLNGFPWFEADSGISTPALANLTGTTDQIIEGGASTAGNAYNTQYSNGGHLRILSSTGNAGQPTPSGGLSCQYNTDEEVDSSPAVGHFGPGQSVAITFGTGSFYAGAATENQLLSVNTGCGLLWATTLDGHTSSSPALVNALGGSGGLQIAEGTDKGAGGGSVYLVNGATGQVIWTVPAAGEVIGSITSADLTGGGYQDLLVPTTAGVEILDGRSGAQVGLLGQYVGVQNSPLVTSDPNGTIGITVAGYVSGASIIDHYELPGSNGATVNEAGAWPMFHHDPQLSGNAGGIAPAPTNVSCSPPPGGPYGYREVASDGGVFTYGNLPFCGSTGALTLTQPVVGTAATRSGGGYWLVAADGGIFSFGDATFYGSTGSLHLNQPIVAMAPTPDGGGYWLVARDGGIFSFGDATFYGSTGSLHLNAPIVGMAPSADGRGYWLVAADGGIFSFGDATFHGSTGSLHLNQPIVGMAGDSATGGYWLVAADGGIFAFSAPFDGSMGGTALNRPIVGMQATSDGSGYRLVATDGGIFDFGTAGFFGSTGAMTLNRPIVGLSGTGS